MIENWVDFVFNVIGGATAFLCLFDGTRRLCAYGVHRKAVLMTVLAAGICALYGGVAHWEYSYPKAAVSMNQRKGPGPPPAPELGRLSPGEKGVFDRARGRPPGIEAG